MLLNYHSEIFYSLKVSWNIKKKLAYGKFPYFFVSQLKDAQSKVKEMGKLMKEVRVWLDEVEDFIKFLRQQNDPQKESKIQEKIEVKNIFFFVKFN